MVRYLRSDATPLSDKDIQDIINAKNTMKRASEAMAIKYKISSRRVYQIWRGIHPPINSPNRTLQEKCKISSQELDELYKKEAKRDEKIIKQILSIIKK